jgi:hypothetical protein
VFFFIITRYCLIPQTGHQRIQIDIILAAVLIIDVNRQGGDGVILKDGFYIKPDIIADKGEDLPVAGST